MSVLLVVCAAGPPSAQAAGNAYNVFKCHDWAPYAEELQEAGSHSSYQRIEQCGPQSSDLMFGIANTGAASNNAFEQYMYSAPPGTRIARACMQHRLRRQSHHRAEIFAYPGFAPLVFGGDEPSGWSPNQCFDLNHEQIIVRLSCSNTGDCPAGPNAHAFVKNLVLVLSDGADPVIQSLRGTLLAGGWIRGTHNLQAAGIDAGAGPLHVIAYANARELGRSQASCRTGGLGWPSAVHLIPCPEPLPTMSLEVDTARAPFGDGSNAVSVYLADFAGNVTEQRSTVQVDNTPPSTGFVASQDPDDPELIRAVVRDATSGVAGAQLHYRRVGESEWLSLPTKIVDNEARASVDSSAVAAGEYEFLASVQDAAGNSASTTRRADGEPMRLTFPLRDPVRLHASVGGGRRQVVSYGTSSVARGRLVSEGGEPLAEREVLVTEHFGRGALIRERPTTVTTDHKGRFKSKIPAGPSRTVVATFAGTQKYLPLAKRIGSLAVRSRARFRTSREAVPEGGRVAFKGKVAHFGARIPRGGKLIELQVRVGAREWDTVKEAFRTDGRGRFKLGYRFGRHYVSNARFRFRVKVQDEGNWPFERSTSVQRRVIVRAR